MTISTESWRLYEPGPKGNYFTSTVYDRFGRTQSVTRRSQEHGLLTERMHYNGLSTQSINASDQVKTETRNAMGEIISVVDNIGNTTRFRHDASGNVTEVEVNDNSGTLVRTVYDAKNRVIERNDPTKGRWTYQFNGFGELLSQTNSRGFTVTMDYDDLGRMVFRQEQEGTTCWTYDRAENGIGKVSRVRQFDGGNKLLL